MRESTVPPYSNRGVQNTEPDGLISSVDWFSCTFKHAENVEEVIRIIGMDLGMFKQMKYGNSGYKKGIIFNSIKILYDGAEDMGIHVNMSGEGCRTFEKYSNLDWRDLFIRFSVHYVARCNITRIDLAVDDFRGYFKIPALIKHLKNGHVTSKFKLARGISNFIIKTGEEIGHTLYFGRPTSDIQIRFYEKNIEQEMKGRLVPDTAKVWNRTEIQARDDRAEMLVLMLAKDSSQMGNLITGVLKNYINFRRAGYVGGKLTHDTNKSRWDSAVWWERFLGDVDKIKLTLRPSEVSIEKKYNWFDKGVTKTFAMMAAAFPDDSVELINNFIDVGISKMEDDDWDLVNEFKENNSNLKDFLSKEKSPKLEPSDC